MAADDALIGITGPTRRRLEAIRDALVREMALRLSRLDQSGGRLVGERMALDNARRIRSQILELMREQAMPVTVSAAEAAVADAVELALGPAQRVASRGIAPGLSVTLDAEAKATIARSVSGVLDDVAMVFGDGADAIRRAMDLGISTGASLQEVTRDVAAAIDTTFQRASVAVETAVRGANRMALVQQAEAGGEATGTEIVYLYDGPQDLKVRDFCDDHVGRCYSLAALRRLDNGMGLPVEIHCGGYACRHRLVPMPIEMAREEGYEVVL